MFVPANASLVDVSQSPMIGIVLDERHRSRSHEIPVIRSTTRIAERTVAMVPWPGKTESPTIQIPGPKTSESTEKQVAVEPA